MYVSSEREFRRLNIMFMHIHVTVCEIKKKRKECMCVSAGTCIYEITRFQHECVCAFELLPNHSCDPGKSVRIYMCTRKAIGWVGVICTRRESIYETTRVCVLKCIHVIKRKIHKHV